MITVLAIFKSSSFSRSPNCAQSSNASLELAQDLRTDRSLDLLGSSCCQSILIMSLRHRRVEVVTRNRPLSPDNLGLRHSSLLFKILPSCVQSRVPKFELLRRTSSSLPEPRGRSASDSSDAQTPPPRYCSQAPSVGTETESLSSLGLDTDSMMSEVTSHRRLQAESDILWKYGNQGKPPQTKLYGLIKVHADRNRNKSTDTCRA